MKTRLYLVRHGQSPDNAMRRFGGRRDGGLTAQGKEQAMRAAERLEAERPDVVMASSLLRAQLTAEAVGAKCGLDVLQLPHWEEACFGLWEGLTYAEAKAMHPRRMRAWMKSPLTVAPPDGESFQDVFARVSAALTQLFARHRGKRLVLVTHEGPIRAALVTALRAPLHTALHLTVDHGAVTIIDDYNGFPVVVSMNV